MNKIAFLFNDDSSRSRYLFDVLKNEYDILPLHTFEETMSLFENDYNKIAAFIIDRPSQKERIDEIFKYIDNRNSYMFTLPVLLLSELSLVEEDEKYLSDLAVGMIYEGESKKVVLQRINNTIKFSNSASFDDFSKMLEVLPSLIYLKDKTGRYAFSSQHWHHFSSSFETTRGLTDDEMRKNKENARIAKESDARILKTGVGESYVIKEDDEEGIDYLQVIKEPLKDANGEVNGIIAIINNVTEEEILRQELRKKSITDQLTGLYNRFYFEELVEQYKSNITLPLTVLSADCDGLKTINDKYGHAAGDQYICFARDAIKERLPNTATLFRMGGDEFIALIPGMNAYQANKLTKHIMASARKYKSKEFSLKLSVGSYTITRKNISIEAAMMHSDKAMYRVKQTRKKRKYSK